MERIKIVSAFLALSLLVVPSVNAAELKVGFVDITTVLDKSPQKQQALARLEKEFAEPGKALETRSKSLERKLIDFRLKQEKLAQDSAILSADERKAKERSILRDQRELNSEQRELKRLEEEYSEDVSIRRNEELRKLEKNIAQTITDLAKKESYDLVLYQGVIYAGDSINITKKVLEILKTK